MVEPFFDDEALGKAYDHHLMRRLLGYLRPHRRVVILAIFLLLLLSALHAAGPLIIMKIINGPIADQDHSALLYWIGIFVGVMVIQFIVQFANMIITQWIGQQTMLDLRTQIFDHLMTMGLRFFDRNPVGRLLTRVTGDVNTLSEMFSSGVVTVFGDVFTLTAYVIAMLYLNVEMSLVAFLVLPLLIAATWIFKRRVRLVFREVRRLIARLNAYWQERLTGMPVVQGFNQQGRIFQRQQQLNAELRGVHLRSVLYYAVFFPVVEFIGALSLALIVWYGGGKVAVGAMSFGALVAFIQYAERFYAPIRDLAEKYNIFQGAMASSERIFKLLDTRPLVPVPEQAVVPTEQDSELGSVVFDNVWFAYEGEEWVLKDISFAVAPGETVAIVGATGAGKTSIANLMTRLYEFQRGTISVDGVDIRDWDPVALRRHVGTTSQEVFLFSGAVADNIRLDSPMISDDEVAAIGQRVGIASLLRGDGDGQARSVGERGSGLSLGEKQLVAFARAMAFNPGILILDEATASVDHRTEARIQAAMKQVFAGRTNIVIAHRLSTIRTADRIIVLHKGSVREVGTHDELMAQDGIYARLSRLQAEDEREEAVTAGRDESV